MADLPNQERMRLGKQFGSVLVRPAQPVMLPPMKITFVASPLSALSKNRSVAVGSP